MSETDTPSSSGSAPGGRRRAPRDRFTPAEIETVCEHYDLGPIYEVRELPKGSHRSPKAVILADAGEYLLKRRAPGRDSPQRLAFVHDLQTHLQQQQFPMPALVRTARHKQTVVRHQDRLYELFEFVHGSTYKGTLEETDEAGRMLGRFHLAAASFSPTRPPPKGSFHAVSGLGASLHQIPATLERVTPGAASERPVEMSSLVRTLRQVYHEALRTVEEAGLPKWGRQAIHSDWHPGNMLFEKGRVTSVLDFDSSRWEPRLIDLANGALQFSITMGGGDVGEWPDYLDETRLKRFCRGYLSVEGCALEMRELQALPSLMVEALIVEAVVPIATTGSFAHMEGGDFLIMVARKASWIRRQTGRLIELIAG
jgi:Ser/Thr protein kinase RdoA (MazF antagonist)